MKAAGSVGKDGVGFLACLEVWGDHLVLTHQLGNCKSVSLGSIVEPLLRKIMGPSAQTKVWKSGLTANKTRATPLVGSALAA